MSLRAPVYIVGAGCAHPERELTSVDLADRVPGLPAGWSEQHLGMTSRHVLGIDESVNDLTIAALSTALEHAHLTGDDLDMVLCGNVFPEQVVPASASFVARSINPDVIAFDVKAACASFIYALATSTALLDGRGLRRAAVCSGEHPTAYADYSDSRSCVFFGDAAGAVVVTTDEPARGAFEIVDIELNGDHEFPERVFVPRHGYFRSDGRYSFSQVCRLGSAAIRELFDRNDVDPDAIVGLAMHQASQHINDSVSEAIGVPVDRHWHNFEWAGNQSAAGVATAFASGWTRHRDVLRDGDHVLLAAVGGGYTGAAALLRWKM
ncbi:MAG: ketoacyl-ACP synthase III [Actinobacteria bacterium]|nr:ketoacyl-ACP synthase III [Actinomycetota bacterium]